MNRRDPVVCIDRVPPRWQAHRPAPRRGARDYVVEGALLLGSILTILALLAIAAGGQAGV